MMVGHSMSEVSSFIAEDIEARSGTSHEGESDSADGSSIADGNGDKILFLGSDGRSDMSTSNGGFSPISSLGDGDKQTHKKLYHCTGFPLWSARATEELSRGSVPSATSRPLYGVLVCLRPIAYLEFRPAECMPIQHLCKLAAERVVAIRRKAEKLGASFVRRTVMQARKDLDEKHGGDVGRYGLMRACLPACTCLHILTIQNSFNSSISIGRFSI
jgi:hypothetical protein